MTLSSAESRGARAAADVIDGVADRGGLGKEQDLAVLDLGGNLLAVWTEDFDGRLAEAGKHGFHDVFARDVQRVVDDERGALGLAYRGPEATDWVALVSTSANWLEAMTSSFWANS